MKKTNLTDSGGQPIYVGDKFMIQKHFDSECCEHWIKCEVREDKNCLSGFGLYEIETGKFIVNAGIACYREKE